MTAVLVSPTLWFIDSKQLAALALQHRLATIHNLRQFAEAGVLISYGANFAEYPQRSAVYVDKIFKGAKPGRPPGRAADQVRAGHQPQDRQGARPHDPAVAAGAGGSGDRVMDRRRFLLTSLAGVLAAPLAAEAQQAAKVPRIGCLGDRSGRRTP